MKPGRGAEYGRAAVRAGTPDQNDERTNLADTLANLMHYADSVDVDFDDALDSARENHYAETHGED